MTLLRHLLFGALTGLAFTLLAVAVMALVIAAHAFAVFLGASELVAAGSTLATMGIFIGLFCGFLSWIGRE